MSTGQEIELAEQVEVMPATMFGSNDPVEVVAQATRTAAALADVIQGQNLFQQIGRRKHVMVEGWTLLGSMLGVFPITVWTNKLENGYEARVEARTRSGDVVGAAEAMCTRDESRWARADDYAIRSMAQTRATSKALRLPLGFVMTLAGYDATPQEEVVDLPVQPQPQVQMITEQTVMELTRGIQQAEFIDPDRWNLGTVLASASRVFGRNIAMLGDLSEEEARRILQGAEAVVQNAQAEYDQSEETND